MPFWIPGVPNPVFSPQSLPFRPALSTSLVMFIRRDGNDNNSGFTNDAVGAKATWNNAYTTAASFDFNNHTVTLFNGSGATTYSTGLGMFTPWVGGGSLVVDLNGGTIAAQTTSVPNKAILNQMAIPTSVKVQNGTLSAQTFSGLENAGVGVLQLGTGLTFGTCGSYQMEASVVGAIISGSGVQFTVNGTSGGGLFGALFGGQIFMVSATALITANVTYSNGFAFAQSLGQILSQFATYSTGAFTVSGPRFSVSDNAVIGTGGTNSATFFPGTVAGTAFTGGQYT